jgi:hypothetical protein
VLQPQTSCLFECLAILFIMQAKRASLEETELKLGRKISRSRSRSRSRSVSEVRGNDYVLPENHNILLQRNDRFLRKKTHCPNCEQETATIKRKASSEFVWFWCAVLTITSFCMVPFFNETCTDKQYYCAECLELKEEVKGHCCCLFC